MAAIAGAAASADASENVQVVVRVRPLNRAERERADVRVVACDSRHSEIRVRSKAHNRTFTFDRVYDTETDQSTLFDTAVAPVVDEVLRGYSCTVFAYGQTGTGKTFTMEGGRREDGSFDAEAPDAGIIVRAVRRVFKALDACGGESHVKISFLELYNEASSSENYMMMHGSGRFMQTTPIMQKLDDLFAAEPSTFMNEAPPSFRPGGPKASMAPTATMTAAAAAALSADSSRERLKIVEDKRAGIRVQNLEEIPVTSPEEVFSWLTRGISKRATAETACNAQSSRSHCVFTLTIHTKESTPEGEELLKVGKLNLVDLAGSECVGRSGAKDARAREAGNINQSLLTLGRVITALVDHLPHIPYRDSKLTRLLQDSLGGRTKTCIIATLSPSASCLEESMSTLEYANRAKNIKNRPEANQRMSKVTLIKEYSGEIEQLKTRLAAQIAKEGVYLPEAEYDEMVGKIQTLEMNLEELENLKVANEEEIGSLRTQLADVRDELEQMTLKWQQSEAALASTREELADTQEQLATEKTEHEETRVLVQAGAMTEVNLTRQAQATRTTLQRTVDDTEALHAKVDRMKRVTAVNQATAHEYADASGSALEALQQNVHSYAENQAAAMDAIGTFAKTFASQQATDVAGCLASLTKLRTSFAAFCRSNAATAAAFLDEQSKVAEVNTARMGGDRDAVLQRMREMQQSMEGQMDGLVDRLTAQAAALSAWSSSTITAVEDAHRSLQTFVDAHSAQLDATLAEVARAAAAQHGNMEATAAKLQDVKNARIAALQSMGARLQQQIALMITENVETFSVELGDQLADCQADMKSHASSAVQSGDRIRTMVAGAQSSAKEWAARAGGEFVAIRGSIARQYDGVRGQNAGMATEIDRIRTDTRASNATTADAAAAAVSKAVNDVRAHTEALAGYASRCKSSSVATSESCHKDAELLGSQISALQVRAGEAAGNLGAASAGAKDASLAFAGQCAQWIDDRAAAATHFFGDGLRADVTTGFTPAKREYAAPSTWVATSPSSVILDRYRAARSAGIASPVTEALQSRSRVVALDDSVVQPSQLPAVATQAPSAPMLTPSVSKKFVSSGKAAAVDAMRYMPAVVAPAYAVSPLGADVTEEAVPTPPQKPAMDFDASSSGMASADESISMITPERVEATSEVTLDALSSTGQLRNCIESAMSDASPSNASTPASIASDTSTVSMVPPVSAAVPPPAAVAAPRQRRLLSINSSKSVTSAASREDMEPTGPPSARAGSNSRLTTLAARVSKSVAPTTTAPSAAPTIAAAAENSMQEAPVVKNTTARTGSKAAVVGVGPSRLRSRSGSSRPATSDGMDGC